MPTNYLGPGARGDLAHPEYDEAQFLAEGGGGPTPPGQTPRSLTPFVDPWLTGVHYEPGQIVTSPAGKLAKALTQHDSGVYATDLAASRWVEFAGGGGGAALKYGRFTGQITGSPNNAPNGFVLASGATTLEWTDEDATAVGLTEPGLYVATVTAVFNELPTLPFTVALGHSSTAPNIQAACPGNPQTGQISVSGQILFPDASVASVGAIYPNVSVGDEVIAGFTAVDMDVVVVRLGDVPAGATS